MKKVALWIVIFLCFTFGNNLRQYGHPLGYLLLLIAISMITGMGTSSYLKRSEKDRSPKTECRPPTR